jgi:hypothetical protein
VEAEQRQTLVDGDKLAQQGRHAEALAKFKEGFPQANARSPEFIAKIVESALASGNNTEARKWVEREHREKTNPPFGPAGAALSSSIQGELAQANADQERKRIEREEERANEREQAKQQATPTSRVNRANYNRVEVGMTGEEVQEILGGGTESFQGGNITVLSWRAGSCIITVTFDGRRVASKSIVN